MWRLAGLMLLVLMTSSCQAHHATGRSTADTLTTSSTGQVEVPVGWARQEGFADNVQAVESARLYVSSGCMACHVYAGFGNQNLGAPEQPAGRRDLEDAEPPAWPEHATQLAEPPRQVVEVPDAEADRGGFE